FDLRLLAALHDHYFLKNFSLPHLASASRFRFSYVVRLVSVALKLSVLSASSLALSAVPRSWDCKGRRFFLIPKIYFKIFFEAFF
ncbi:hypothetical protein, partial [Sphingobacterium hotanense]|uniref:hypothetical protein n=1 Tax=Sphingobacterium hotanense TaxID=649196 RepID=UPI002578E099